MKIKITIVLWLFAVASLQADWKLKSSEQLGDVALPVKHLKKIIEDDRVVEVHLVLFNSKKCTLKVIDQPRADQGDLSTAMKEHHCLAGVNGNYFHPDRTPLGLVISDGKIIHSLERAKLLSGILTVTKDRVSLLRVAEYKSSPRIIQALQAGPFLVDKGKVVVGLNAEKRAARTVVLTDAQGNAALLVCHQVTLAEMAKIISKPEIISEMKVDRALNLDGGSSTGLWVKDDSEPFYMSEINRVRNYLGIIPKKD